MVDTTTVDATAEFFERLGSCGHEPLLENARGTLEIDLENGAATERWFVSIDKGDIEVSQRHTKPDSTIRMRRDVFDGLARGEANAMASFLRGAFTVDGDFELMVLFRRLLPGEHAVRGGETS
jgi:predicted lipid carrier protein YhbT